MERRSVLVQGTVQGVGFRPFVFGLASRLALTGFVQNRAGSVLIEVEGDQPRLDEFLDAIHRQPPPLARIDSLAWRVQPPVGDARFWIKESEAGEDDVVVISPDVATCDDCLTELHDPANRRYRYPFINCTNCGPRLTIATGAPYDRERTTMARFEMCQACREEYENPDDRRFHAQPIACPACGPRLQLLDADGVVRSGEDPLRQFAREILGGRIGAMKGLGGYHLLCDARQSEAVAELRRRKHRDEKPLAVMVRDAESAEELCAIQLQERALLLSAARPIVLLKKRPDCSIAENVAPGNPCLGVMLPYTPLHHLLLEAVGGPPLVMTSGNRSDEPIAHEDCDAVARLSGIADLFLVHDRPIEVRCDDSVTRIVGGCESLVRRARGYAPRPMRLPVACPFDLLAVGGQLKNTFALGAGAHAFLSQHMGDLDDYSAYQAFERDIELYQRTWRVTPRMIAHDLHPDYASTRYAQRRAEQTGERCMAVQHHHAHMASCLAEHGLTGPVIGVCFDGTGYGTDGAVWGGEFLVGDCATFRRGAHLRYVPMPGGEQAVREPWRMAAAHLLEAGCPLETLEPRVPARSLRTIETLIEHGLNAPRTSSMGRLFDAAAALVGIRGRVSYEGQAAMQLEWLAEGHRAEGCYPFEIIDGSGEMCVVDPRPLVRAVCEDLGIREPGEIARRFHATVAEIVRQVCVRLHAQTGLDRVVLSGGVFMNVLLTTDVVDRLNAENFTVYRHERVPPNDGGLSLGQLAVAVARVAPQRTMRNNTTDSMTNVGS